MNKRAFYLIAHRCTRMKDVEDALKKGANAIECDIRYEDGNFEVEHDDIVYPTERNLVTYLRNVRKLADEYGNKFALMVFDMKDVGKKKIADLLNLIRTELTDTTGINIILSYAGWDERQRFLTISDRLNSNEGLSIDAYNHPKSVAAFFEEIGVTNNCYGNGITEWSPDITNNIEESICKALMFKKRRGVIKLVYIYTLDKKSSMRKYLKIGVDGIMTNDVKDLVNVLRSKTFKERIRLATRDENAFRITAMPFEERFLANRHSKEVHDLNKEDTEPNGCQIDKIHHFTCFTSLDAAVESGYDPCAKCLGEELSEH